MANLWPDGSRRRPDATSRLVSHRSRSCRFVASRADKRLSYRHVGDRCCRRATTAALILTRGAVSNLLEHVSELVSWMQIVKRNSGASQYFGYTVAHESGASPALEPAVAEQRDQRRDEQACLNARGLCCAVQGA